MSVSHDGVLESHLRAQRSSGKKLLVPYITGGYAGWTDAVRAAAANGADAIEIGLPFSDPVMDGPMIQLASEQALARGANPTSILNDCPSKGQLFGGKLDGFKHAALKHPNAATATDFKIIQGNICTLQ